MTKDDVAYDIAAWLRERPLPVPPDPREPIACVVRRPTYTYQPWTPREKAEQIAKAFFACREVGRVLHLSTASIDLLNKELPDWYDWSQCSESAMARRLQKSDI